jgi:hypothetical protein
MKHYDYTDVRGFVHDDELKKLLCIDRGFDELLGYLLEDDFLSIDQSVGIPFFAATRDYVGAVESDGCGRRTGARRGAKKRDEGNNSAVRFE